MQGRHHFTLILLTVLFTASLAGPGFGFEPTQLCSGLAGPDGLVLDNRGNAYTVCRDEGLVWCVPPDGEPIPLARVDAPTCLAVDRLLTVFVGTASGDIVAVMPDGTSSRVHRFRNGVTGLSLDRDGALVAATADGAIIRVPRKSFDWNN